MPRRRQNQTDGDAPEPTPSAQDLEQLREYLSSEKPPVDDDLHQIVGPEEPFFNAGWSQADEDAVRSEWDQSDEKQCLARLPPSLLPPWKVAMRIFRSTPVGIISPLQNLVYQPLPATGRTQTSPIYSEPFSKRFAALMAHPFWQGEVTTLIIAIQYAVICRLDDRRYWEVPIFCDAMRALTNDMDESGTEMPEPIHEMHVEARSRCGTGRPPCAISDFLEHVGNVAKSTQYPPIPSTQMECLGMKVYPVTLKDLDVLTQALNTFSQQGLPIFCKVSMAFEAYKEASSQRDMPSANQLPGFYERAVLCDRRVIVQMTRRGETEHESRAVTRCSSIINAESSIPSQSRTQSTLLLSGLLRSQTQRSGLSTASTVRRPASPTAPQGSDLNNAQIQGQLDELVNQRMGEMRSQLVSERSQLMAEMRSQVVAEIRSQVVAEIRSQVVAEIRSQVVAEVVAQVEATLGDESSREPGLSRRRRYQLPEPEQDSDEEGLGGLDGDDLGGLGGNSDVPMTEPTPGPRDDPRSPSDPLEEDVGILLGPTPAGWKSLDLGRRRHATTRYRPMRRIRSARNEDRDEGTSRCVGESRMGVIQMRRN
ncbi:uncharacterized protein NECHADRAFT_83313 [Fusarium vanettenii 77-13-4]|uniref:Uncharacterized protein n=1 Tax=Fusarium vanettenii (strain ATCC MYA-4622 / CBS 123669 / FGSC 9596 / NRRL 45880 / 77-13-4) TaxID=660122 RepID=C7Z3N6_FUSV7|nr:uncharacterized protein NECHADRAFT_83313 [Fusarium vanettenii 77-13-4]EEU41168.1 predicted protein [Fusarium vanettenii 77-13-4]